MIHIILEASITKNSSPEDFSDEYSIASLPHLPHVGDILRLPDEHDWAYVGRKYFEVTRILHDLRDEDDVEVYIVVKPYPHLQ